MPLLLAISLPALLLCILLTGAVWHDMRSRRIPNGLVFGGALAALLLHAVLTPGAGGLGLPAALGAGDVKLMAMVGAFIGPQQVLAATLLTLLAGGVLSLLVAACTGLLRQVLANSYRMLFHSLLRGISGGNARLDAPQAASGRLPYAIAIAAGTALSFFWSFS